MIPTNFDICNSTWKRIVSKYPHAKTAIDYPETERVVVLVWTLSGILENGGFEYLFESDLPGDAGLALSKKALQMIGCLTAAELIEEILNQINAENDLVSKHDSFMAFPEELRDAWDARFWAEMDNINAKLVNYITENKLQCANGYNDRL